MNKLKSLLAQLKNQNELNIVTCGTDWKKGFTDMDKPIMWRNCIEMEISELIDSTPWKHWKKIDGKIDMINIHIELADIWHFILSGVMEESPEKDYEFHASIINNDYFQATRENNDFPVKTIDIVEYCREIKRESLKKEKIINTSLISAFFELCSILDFTVDNLFKLYFAKGVLNKFRQDNGYKEGTYIKVWDGEEDNKFMYELTIDKNVHHNDLYSRLEKIYQGVDSAA